LTDSIVGYTIAASARRSNTPRYSAAVTFSATADAITSADVAMLNAVVARLDAEEAATAGV
jgi:hypothetical protein